MKRLHVPSPDEPAGVRRLACEVAPPDPETPASRAWSVIHETLTCAAGLLLLGVAIGIGVRALIAVFP